jgi:hypothetical protein
MRPTPVVLAYLARPRRRSDIAFPFPDLYVKINEPVPLCPSIDHPGCHDYFYRHDVILRELFWETVSYTKHHHKGSSELLGNAKAAAAPALRRAAAAAAAAATAVAPPMNEQDHHHEKCVYQIHSAHESFAAILPEYDPK